jgi:hypothetical protein
MLKPLQQLQLTSMPGRKVVAAALQCPCRLH